MIIKPGDRIVIKLGSYQQFIGTVLSAKNYGGCFDEPDNWYIEFTYDRPIPGFLGHGYWKQREDGGTVRVL